MKSFNTFTSIFSYDQNDTHTNKYTNRQRLKSLYNTGMQHKKKKQKRRDNIVSNNLAIAFFHCYFSCKTFHENVILSMMTDLLSYSTMNWHEIMLESLTNFLPMYA